MSVYLMPYIHYPPAFAQDPVVSGPLMQPINEAQRQTYEAAKKAIGKPDGHTNPYSFSNSFASHVGHNLGVVNRRFVPFSVVDSLADLQKPYGLWAGYERLVIVKADLTVECRYFKYEAEHRFREAGLREALRAFRYYRLQATHASDVAGLDAAIHEAIDQIDRSRSVQRKRRETG